METIREIFNNKIFRIPDYQRGYSWEENHLEDFWQDLTNLQRNNIHYTGMISVEEVSRDEYSRWKEDKWIIEGRNDKPYFIVDGQQRITSVIILIWVILDQMDDEEELSFETKRNIIDKYIYTENPRGNHKSYIFGYHKDNPSYEFLKREIFEQADKDSDNLPLEVTAYTNNLLNAKKFFQEKTRLMTKKDLEILYSKITKQLKFDFKVLEKELDIFIVFETMNNRGKPLSNLEKLKNRLIYLSTLLKDEDILKKELREQINDSWKTIYKYLGLSPERKLDDDSFLQNHWIMFARYDRREPEFYAIDIFERVFTTQELINGELTVMDINNYIQSIAEAARNWFIMNNPSHPHAFELLESKKVLSWLGKLNRLGFKSFAPLIMAAMVIEKNFDTLAELLKNIEAYIFLLFNVSFRRSNTGTYHFNAKASELYNRKVKMQAIIQDVKYWVYGDEDYKGYFDLENFRSYLLEEFNKDGAYGYINWKYLRYFLYEYELSISKEYAVKPKWLDYNKIEAIYPFAPTRACWKNSIGDYSSVQKTRLSGSLGNFVLTTKQFTNKEQRCFAELKEVFEEGSANQRELKNYSEWNANAILSRGLKLLAFMENRWNIKIENTETKKKLLFLDFMND